MDLVFRRGSFCVVVNGHSCVSRCREQARRVYYCLVLEKLFLDSVNL
jgi:hypothetical protein